MFALQLHYDFCTINVNVMRIGIVIVVIISQSEVSNYSYRLAMC